ncbi:serine/threonine-protein kinase [Nocardia tengchongensis]|uniref:serine/threonine-protein kinase n=1 Tax=Nocardia tengchongensis TaxID=2055889 RepID=UPI003690ED25
MVDILRHIARGLQSLAAGNVQHRDLKPGNVLSIDGRWRIADFGISRDLDVSTQGFLTFKGEGTWEYKAPEAFDQAGAASEKSDLYSLGIIAFELITGASPFTAGGLTEIMRLHRVSPVPELPDHVPTALSVLIHRLLSKDPARRPASAAAVLDALNEVLTPPTDSASRLQAMAVAVAKRENRREIARAADEAEDAERIKQATEGIADLEAIWAEAINRVGNELGSEAKATDRLMHPGVAVLTWNGFELRIEIHNSGRWDGRAVPMLFGNVFVREGVGVDFSDSQLPRADLFYLPDPETGQFGWHIRQWNENETWTGRPLRELVQELASGKPPLSVEEPARTRWLNPDRIIEIFTEFIVGAVE